MPLEEDFEIQNWGKAVVMAKYIQNPLPAREIEKTPYLFVQMKIDQKIDLIAINTSTVGYNMVLKAFRFFVPITGKCKIHKKILIE